MSAAGPQPPQLTRTGSGRSARLGALLAVTLVAGSVAIALADRPPPAIDPLESNAVIATPTPNAPATTSPPYALDRGNGWPRGFAGDDNRWLRPVQSAAGAFLLATLSGGDAPVTRHALAGPSEPRAFMVVPPAMWQHEPVLELAWIGGEPARRHVELVAVPLSLGSSTDLGLPVRQASGKFLLPGPVNGSSYWRYSVVVDRAHAYSNPQEWAVIIEVAPIDGRRVCHVKASAWARGSC